MTPEEIRAEIDVRLAAQWPALSAAQATYYAANGRYAQGLPTHSAIPADGVEVAPDRAADHPSDQAESWNDLGALPATMLSQLQIDAYGGPSGQGYVVVSRVMLGGALWAKAVNVGPETWRGRAWAEVPASDT